MMPFLALHHITAQRGDGLRPDLVQLLEGRRRSALDVEGGADERPAEVDLPSAVDAPRRQASR